MNEPLDILVFGAHADDAEIGMAGTIVKHTRAGYRVGICDLTFAEMSSNGTVELRQQEAESASAVLGLSMRSNLGLPDRGLTRTDAHIQAIVAEIRKWAPRMIFAPYWEDRHPDHIACSQLIEEAIFNAKLRRYMPEIAPVTVSRSYFYFINDMGPADLTVDVTDVYSEKEASLRCYASQFTAPAPNSDAVATPLTAQYVERVKARDSLLGQKCGFGYAEGFASRLPHTVHLF
ncbi:bacillithiol biosynthesis deacetylase BshB1 [Saccharibacillus sp. JS10]|uniref:bacillithiol biosynthesis deacetylase BshB1 n=1 Tax=Saccharibacillus sp. JS10 TaxID=2950552 RepID=UPI00210AA334|nr:bacillithiol biosynthesis deacetylase BshB1 [Saccharibacillus sp. JS10]MCQ4085774.1 bacillithiol biosynthesis deacetylase BshB1 [Saccharibacillus sp. JS10]